MPRHPGRSRVILVLLAVGAAVVGVLASLASKPLEGAPLAVEASPVPLDASDPARDRVGPLLYLGGLWLRSADPRFGGLSDLRVSPDGARLFAVSDCGYGFTATLSYDAEGRLDGLADPRLVSLTDTGGRPLGRDVADAESLVLDDGIEVGFEGRGKVRAFATEPAFAGPARALGVPAGLGGCGRNGGLETMTDTGDGRRLLVCEGRRGPSSTVPAWIGRGDAWQAREYPLAFDGGWAGEPFRPTGAALLPDGDLLVVERRFPPAGARLARIPRASLDATSPLERREVARIEAPLTIDNFEGVEARTDAAGRTLVYLLSDDNGCAKTGSGGRRSLQRTLLLLFALGG
jgi:hypothetical protein